MPIHLDELRKAYLRSLRLSSEAETNSFRGPQKPTDGKTKTKKKKKKGEETYAMPSGVKNPDKGKNKDNVPDAKKPTLDNTGKKDKPVYASNQAAVAGLVENIEKRITQLENAKSLADRLMKKGITGEEFAKLYEFLQEDVLHSLLSEGVTAGKKYSADVLVQAARMKRS